MNHLKVATLFKDTERLHPLPVFLLPPDVFPYRLFLFASCRDVDVFAVLHAEPFFGISRSQTPVISAEQKICDMSD